MRATYEVWGEQHSEPEERPYHRRAGAGVTVWSREHESHSWTTPSARIAQLTAELIKEYLGHGTTATQTPHTMLHDLQQLVTTAQRYAMEWAVDDHLAGGAADLEPDDGDEEDEKVSWTDPWTEDEGYRPT